VTTTMLMPELPAHADDEQLFPYLRRMHADWQEELHSVLDPARRPEAWTWIRWRAIHYLDVFTTSKVEPAGEVLREVRHQLPDRDFTRLWAATELLESLHWQLGHLIGICPRCREFSLVIHKFLEAFNYWCREVEETLGSLTWGELPAESIRILSLLHESAEYAA
jgi:hypothetical protein